MLVLVLSCGCFKTVRSRTPPKSTPCIACFVKDEVHGRRDMLDELMDAIAAVGGRLTIAGRDVTRDQARRILAAHVLDGA